MAKPKISERYIVEIKKGKKWVFYSDHGWDEIAKINADTVTKTRKLQARVKHTGKVIYEKS